MSNNNLLKSKPVYLAILVILFLISPALTVCADTTDISIKYFDSSASTVSKGLTVQLYWKVENASRIDITCSEKSLDGNFPLEGSIKVWPTETSTYVLRAYGNNDELVATCAKTIDVLDTNEFRVSSTLINPGESIYVFWNFPDAIDVEITPLSEMTLHPTGKLPITLNETTAFTLIAYDMEGNEIASKEITVTVKKLTLETVQFSTYKEDIEPGEEVTLFWDAGYAKEVSITGLQPANQNNRGSVSFALHNTTTYTLLATGYDGTVISKQITINVKSPEIPPQIFEFWVNKEKIFFDETATLLWKVPNAKKVSITGFENISLPSEGSLVVKPNKTTTYILTAILKDGTTEIRQITVTVSKIKSFTPSRTFITKGKLVILSWVTCGANACSLMTSRGNITNDIDHPNGYIAVTPSRNITYTLIINDETGVEEERSDILITVE